MKKIFKGFTLIELLVVISIIGILASVVVASYITAQKQARDSARRAAIKNVESSFEQYYAENGVYPNSSALIDSAFSPDTRPKDPRDPTTSINWTYANSTTGYCVCATLETGTGNANAPSSSSCSWNSAGTYYCTQNKQ